MKTNYQNRTIFDTRYSKKIVASLFLLVGLSFGFLILNFGFAAPAAAVPQQINYQGVLRDKAGALQTGSYAMHFKIFNNSSGSGSALYDSGAKTVVVNQGIYNVTFEATPALFSGGNRWLEVVVEGDAMSPLLKINSVAYAIMAASAESATYAVTAGSANTATTATTATSATTATTANFASNAALLGGLATKESGIGIFVPVTQSDGVLSSLVVPSTGIATQAANSLLLGGYAPGVSGNSIVPTTDATGKLSSAVLPPTGIATSAAYADNAGLLGGLATSETFSAKKLVPVTDNAGKLANEFLKTGSENGLDADTLDTYHAGNNTSQVPISNTTVCTDLNADTVDGVNANTVPTASFLYPLDSGANFTLNKTNANGTPVMTVSNEGNSGSIALFAHAKGGAAVSAESITGTAIYANSVSGGAVSAESSSGIAVYAKSVSGGAVSAESDTGTAVYANGGYRSIQAVGTVEITGQLKLNGCVGTGVIPDSLAESEAIPNTRVTSSSIILLTVGHGASPAVDGANKSLKVSVITPGVSFKVKTIDNSATHAVPIPFSYLIIN